MPLFFISEARGVRREYVVCEIGIAAGGLGYGEPVLVPPTRAQSTTASIHGAVSDPSGAPVPHATVVATETETNGKTTAASATDGTYTLLGLNPGTYRVQVSAPGFKDFVRKGIILNIGQHTQLNATLQLGQASQTITVEANVTTLNPVSATISDVVNNREIRNLPLNTRNIFSLVYLTPGVSGSVGNNYNAVSIAVNGHRTGTESILIGGVPGGFPTVNGFAGASVFPSVDAISEFRVLAQNYPAEFGRSSAGIVNIVYKSGTNRFHGALYEFLRNSDLDANDFFNNAHGVPLPGFRRNQFGGELGGPIRKNKTFFLFSIEELKQSSSSSTSRTVPTALERQGDFSQTFAANGNLVKIYNPFSTITGPDGTPLRTQFANNTIPKMMIDPVAANVLPYYPLANTAGNPVTHTNNFFAGGADVNNVGMWAIRIDHNITDSQKLFARYSHRSYKTIPATFFPSDIAVAEGNITKKDFSHNAVVGYSNALNPTTVVDAHLGFARTLFYYLNPGLGFLPSKLGFPDYMNTAGGLDMFPEFGVSGYTTLGDRDNRLNSFMTYSANASLSKVAGKHTLKMGFDMRMLRVNDNENRDPSGRFLFSQGFTQGPDANVASATSGNGLASLLLGTGSGDVIEAFKNVATQSYYFAWYLQDEWHVLPNFTLDLGIRYDLNTPRTERFNRMNYFDPGALSPLAPEVPAFPNLQGGLVFVGIDGRPRTQYIWDKNDVAPRLGFAWQATPKTVVRGGWGVVYGISLQQAMGTVGPFGYRVENDWIGSLDGVTPLNLLSNPFPDGTQPPTGSSLGLLTGVGGSIQSDLQKEPTPYTYEYNINVQRELPGQMMIQVGYVGNRTYETWLNREGGYDLDQVRPQYLSLGPQLRTLVPNPFYGKVTTGLLAAPTVTRMQLLRPYPQFTSVVPLYLSGGATRYDGLQAQLKKRLSFGLQFDVSYSWSKTFDTHDSHQDSYNLGADWGLAPNNVPQRFVANFIYDLPYGHGRTFGANSPGAVNAVLGGWQVQSIIILESGTPLEMSANNVAGIGNPEEYPNMTGEDPHIPGPTVKKLDEYFNTAAFSQPAPFTFGNSSHYVSYLSNPGVANTDFSVFKQFAPTENVHVQFRAEFFNLFNRVQFDGPNTSVTSPDFGVITSQANSPRQIQFALKLLF